MILNGVKIISKDQLLDLISELDADTKAHLLATYNAEQSIEKDQLKYEKRAAAKDTIMAEMAAENMDRVRRGIWTVANLVELTQDAQLKLVLDDITSLSFELAAQKLMAITNPLVTTEIKLKWIAKLQSHFYNG